MRFVIVGAGAMGIIFGAALSCSGHQVALLGRPSPRLDMVRKNGIRIQTTSGSIEHIKMSITDDPSVSAGAEVLIVLVKSNDTASAMDRVKPHLRPGTPVLTLQNGLGNVETIREVLGVRARVLAGITSQGATRAASDLVIHAGEGPTLIGYLSKDDAPTADALVHLLSDAGLPAAAAPQIEHWLWHKVAINSAINGLSALGGFLNGEIASCEEMLDAGEIVAEEAAAVARALGYELGGMRRALCETARATAANRSSMLQDLEAGRETEVDAIHGAILDAAAEVGIAAPATAVLAALIRSRTRKSRSKETNDA